VRRFWVRGWHGLPVPVSEKPVPTSEATADFRRLVDELQVLINRSRRRTWRAPLLCLLPTGVDAGGGDPLDELARLLGGPDKQVPHVRLGAAEAAPGVAGLLNKGL
jgi:hypothetical protein